MTQREYRRYFGSSTNVPAAVVSLSLNSDAALTHFRKYEGAVGQSLSLDRRRSFFVYAREVVIVGRGASSNA
jgi:hypothetical protein